MVWPALSLLAALALELVAAWQAPAWPDGALLSLFAHLAASMSGSFGAAFLSPPWCKGPFLSRMGVYLLLMLCMPLIALPGVIFLFVPALFRPRARPEPRWRPVDMPDLPFRPVRVESRRDYGEGGVAAALQFARDPERRLKAVTAARQMSDQLAIPVLRQALKDPVDEVRLFAYSVLDARESMIQDRINAMHASLDGVAGKERARLHYALAQNYWELAFLGLSVGGALEYALENAERHAALAAESGWSGADIEFMLAKILLRRGMLDEAEAGFLAALRHGALEEAVFPYLAEAAYERRKWGEVRNRLRWLDELCDGHSPIPALVRTWGGAR